LTPFVAVWYRPRQNEGDTMAGKNRMTKEDGRARKGAAALPFAVDRRKPGSLVDQLADGLPIPPDAAIRSVYRRGETF